MKKIINKKFVLSIFGIFVFLCGAAVQTFAQDRYAIERAQAAVREKIIRDKGGNVEFPTYMQTETYYISRDQTGVRGYGTWTRRFGRNDQDFSYEARVNTNSGKVDKISYKIVDENDGNNSGGKVPSWAVGTFYGRNPQDNSQIKMTITENGNVNVDFQGGNYTNGNFYNNRITIDGAVARVTRINNGIRTTRVDNGESIDYYRDGNYDNGNNNGGNVSSWAIGTFYGRNPQTGGQIMMTISRNGSVTVNMGNSNSYGTLNGDRLTINGISSRITRLNNGIRTTRFDNGESIDYYRDGNNNSGGGGNIPSWAIGTFYGRNPQTGNTISITIQENGNVTVSGDGAVVYGTMYDDTLTINGVSSRVTQIRNGIRTTRNDNGERIEYRKR
jgi:hypothetical protein